MTAAGIVGVLLAAGAGTRFGGDKLLAPLPPAAGAETGVPIGVAACAHLRAAVDEVVAVVRPEDVVLTAALAAAGAAVVGCPRASEGMGASLACGVARAAQAQGWLIGLADMPWIVPWTMAMLATHLARADAIVVPRYRGRRGHPVGFGVAHRAALLALHGDMGARGIVQAHAGSVIDVDVDDPGVLRDVDTPRDLRVGSG
jgi:molybdenum cofactor cytidylyltransferase